MKNVLNFKNTLKEYTKVVFQSVLVKEKQHEINGFSLYTDEDASSIGAAYNTFKFFNERCKEDPEEDREYYRWYPAEWQEEGIEDDRMNALSKELFERKSVEYSSKDIFTAIVTVLRELKEEKLFENMHNEFVLCFSISDYADLDNEILWVKALNDGSMSQEFVIWRNRVEVNYE